MLSRVGLLDHISCSLYKVPLRLSVLHVRVPVVCASFASRPQSASVTSTEFLRGL